MWRAAQSACLPGAALAELQGETLTPPPADTALGALFGHIIGNVATADYQPMNVNFGLFPPISDVKKKQRKEAYTSRARASLAQWMTDMGMTDMRTTDMGTAGLETA